MESNPRGGIGALYSILIKFWGAVERDLICAGLRFTDVDTERFTFEEFTSFVLNSPPGTAVYHRVTSGYGVGDRLLAKILDAGHDLLWAKTKDAHQNPPRNRPERTWIPGMEKAAQTEPKQDEMTVGRYLELVAQNEDAA
ncbi:hypothetical protein NIIDNTM18_42160 [Mycolicibacterium litorale]|uniref:Uncharacterized protein n=1 Tax=Mycolicibacterium litorale TaxID=758802 RepID=A0A6S6PG21_9MYCO|nr:DUF5361 domain-containing protein [Mycolicibacterium litorale]BCI54938.1 hypothetical protein NIIDNTM18_42160 [Mycolicibacterium litorale]